VELLSALLTIIAFFYFQFPFNIFYAVSFYFLLVFFFTDLKYGLVPVPVFLVGLYFVSASYVLFYLYNLMDFEYVILTYASAAGSSIFFMLLILISRGRGMGFGDVLLAFLFSLVCGFPSSTMMIFLSFVMGGSLSLLLLILGKKRFGQSLPFGPFMVTSSLILK